MTAILNFIKKSREHFLDRHYPASDFHNRMFSGGTYSTWLETNKILREYCSGLTLDAGSGRGAWKSTILEVTPKYESIEIAPRGDHVPTWLGDITDMAVVPNERYDTVFCQQVLEHVPQPFEAIREINRVLKPDGRLILTVPHLSRRHELPHDYYRYTQNGLKYIFENSGFSIAYLVGYGGIISFLHHQASFLFPGFAMGLPLIGDLCVLANTPFSFLTANLDRLLDRASLLPAGIAIVGIKSNPGIDTKSEPQINP